MHDINANDDINGMVKILTQLVVDDKRLFLEFIRRLAMSSEETQDMTTLAVSSHPTETKIP